MSLLAIQGWEDAEALYSFAATKGGAGTTFEAAESPHTFRGKGGAWALKAAGGESVWRGTGLFTGAKERETWFNFALKVDKELAGNREIVRLLGTGSEPQGGIQLEKNGTINAFTNAFSGIGTGKKLTFNEYHWVSIMIYAHSEASKAKFQIWLDGENIYENNAWSSGNFTPEGVRLGWLTSEATATIFFDDLIITDSVGSTVVGRQSEQVVKALVPVSDKARTGFLNGGGGTTELFKGCNVPGKGVANGSKTSTSQVYDATSSTTDNYEANLKSYEEAGLAEGDEVIGVQPVMSIATSATTARSMGVSLASNPEIAEATANTPAAAAGTHPTNWISRRGTIKEKPSVTLATKPVLKLRKNAATTDATAADSLMALVAFIPAATPTATNVARVSLTTGQTPISREKHKIIVRAKKVSGSGTVKLKCALYEGSNNRSGDLESSALSTSLATYEFAISKASAESISDYSNLELRFSGVSSTGDKVEVEVADAKVMLPEAKPHFTVGSAFGASTAQVLTHRKRITLKSAAGTSTAKTLTHTRHVPLKSAAGTSAAKKLSASYHRKLSMAAATSAAQKLAARKNAHLAGTAGSSAAQPLKIKGPTHRSLNGGTATSKASALTRHKSLGISAAASISAADPLSTPRRHAAIKPGTSHGAARPLHYNLDVGPGEIVDLRMAELDYDEGKVAFGEGESRAVALSKEVREPLVDWDDNEVDLI